MRWTAKNKFDWHPVFAWFPTEVTSGVWIWLESFERKYTQIGVVRKWVDREI